MTMPGRPIWILPECDQLAASGMMLSLGNGSTELSAVINRPMTQYPPFCRAC